MTDEQFIADAVEATQKLYPRICYNGILPFYLKSQGNRDFKSESFKKQILQCRDWLAFFNQRKTINTEYSSYSLKHRVEKWGENYVCNGALIIAATGLDFKSKPCNWNSPNVYFNLAKLRKTIKLLNG